MIGLVASTFVNSYCTT